MSQNVISWGNTSYTHLYKLIILQKRVIRTISDVGYRDHTSPLFYRLELLKFPDIYVFHTLIYMFQEINNDNYSVQHNLNTRNRDRSVPIFQRLTRTQRSVNFAGPTLWNNLPLNLKSIDSLPLFKKKLKTYLLSKYSNSHL